MNNLKKEFIIERKDIETQDQKIFMKYSKILKAHKNLKIRLNNLKSDLLNINLSSIQKIFDYLDNEIPEEYILFLFEKPYEKNLKHKQNNNNIISTSEPSLDKSKENGKNNEDDNDEDEENDEKKEFLTLEIENPDNPVLKKFKTLTYQIMKKYYCIFCILCLIVAILFTIHLFNFLISKEVSINYYKIFLI